MSKPPAETGGSKAKVAQAAMNMLANVAHQPRDPRGFSVHFEREFSDLGKPLGEALEMTRFRSIDD